MSCDLNSAREVQITCREFTGKNKINFKMDLSNVDWNILGSCHDANSLYETVVAVFLELYNINFPLKTKRIKLKDLKTVIDE